MKSMNVNDVVVRGNFEFIILSIISRGQKYTMNGPEIWSVILDTFHVSIHRSSLYRDLACMSDKKLIEPIRLGSNVFYSITAEGEEKMKLYVRELSKLVVIKGGK